MKEKEAIAVHRVATWLCFVFHNASSEKTELTLIPNGKPLSNCSTCMLPFSADSRASESVKNSGMPLDALMRCTSIFLALFSVQHVWLTCGGLYTNKFNLKLCSVLVSLMTFSYGLLTMLLMRSILFHF